MQPTPASSMSGASDYWIHPLAGIEAVRNVCRHVLSANRERLSRAWIDAYSDLKVLPEDAQAALAQLEKIATERHQGEIRNYRWWRIRPRAKPSFSGINLDPRRDEHLDLLLTFGPFSIHAEIYVDGENEPFMVMHDSGTSITFRWKDDRLNELANVSNVPIHWLVRGKGQD